MSNGKGANTFFIKTNCYMLNNQLNTSSAAQLSGTGTSAHETGISFSTLNPYEYLHRKGIHLHKCSIRFLAKPRKNGVAITGVFNINGIGYTVGSTDYEHLMTDLLERYHERCAYHRACRERKKERNMISFINRHPDATVFPAWLTSRPVEKGGEA